MKNKINAYFKNRGIDVEYNMLGHNQQLVDAYVAATVNIVEETPSKKSQDIKHACYSNFYNFEPRPKFTGFEKYDDMAMSIRKQLTVSVEPTNMLIVTEKAGENQEPYDVLLIKQAKSIELPILLYLSGGIDSEFIANILLSANIKFSPVIFKYINDIGIEQNEFDTDFAFKFCKANNLVPIVKTINIDTLWNTDEFITLAQSVGLVSPHLTTHAYMIQMINDEYPGHKHLFGGEVRYTSNSILENDGSYSNLVQLNKVAGGALSADAVRGGGLLCGVFLNIVSDGSFSWGGTSIQTSTPANWYSGTLNPAGYQYQLSAASYSISPANGGTVTPTAATGWLSIPANQVVRVFTSGGQTAYADSSWTLSIKSLADGVVTSWNVYMTAEST